MNRSIGYRLGLRFIRWSQPGQTMAEYGLILAVVAVVALVGYQLLGTDISSLISTVASDL